MKTWVPVKSVHQAPAVYGQKDAPNSVLSHYRRMLDWHRSVPAATGDQITFLDTAEPVLAFRTCETPHGFYLGRKSASVTVSKAMDTQILQNARQTDGMLRLGPNGFLITCLQA
ncbi:hypothetical protein [uncultured Limimaricola sp.]|uniref:hypothetical protein n=1 Tax=uncultured Limimaricola sp. TaxID=2211667 RepID=UPI0030F6C8C5